MITRAFNIQQWIDDHRHLLKPPVGNQQVFKDNKDFIVMVVGGPNARKDYHVDAGEELFWQVEGTMTVKIIEDGKPVDITIGPGEMFLLPPAPSASLSSATAPPAKSMASSGTAKTAATSSTRSSPRLPTS
jgi:3-hydroxyanthranilate 3,4-dioxygenase